MPQLKPLPKALIVAAIVGGVGFTAYKFMPKPATAPAPSQELAVAAPTPAPAAPLPADTPPATSVAPAPAPPPNAVPEPAPTQGGSNVKLAGAGIASGQKTGTNYPMVDNIIKACSNDAYPLRNVITNGTVDNINLVYTNPNSQFGVAQIDALAAQKAVDPKMMSRILAVFPFFSVEVHAIVINGSPINSLADLAGKRVVEGPEGSGTNVTVQLIKKAMGLNWITVPGNLSQADGLKAVQTGQADVEFIVAGQPIGVLAGAQGLKLVPINDPKIDALGVYTRTQLPTGAYPWLGTAVPTYKVDNALVTFAYKNQYQTEIGNLVTCITQHIDSLQQTGHPKWRDVDPLDIDRLKWPTHPAAVKAIKAATKK